MTTITQNDKSDKAVPFTTSEDAAKTAIASGSTAAVDMVNRVAEKAHATIDKLANQATPAVQHLQKSLEGTNELLHQRADQVREKGAEWTDGLRESVRQHPLAAVGTALAIGLLIARLSR